MNTKTSPPETLDIRDSHPRFIEDSELEEYQTSTQYAKSSEQICHTEVSLNKKLFYELHPISEKLVKQGDLEFDIKMGWIPKNILSGPIPIRFSQPYMEEYLKENLKIESLIYVGYRPLNSFDLHKKFYGNGDNYSFHQLGVCKEQLLNSFLKKNAEFYNLSGGRKQGMIIEDSPLSFDSEFEGGNLDRVYFSNGEYKMVIRADSNTKGHCRVRCCVAGRYRFQIINMSKNRSLYQRGMKPFVRNSAHGIWRQNGRNIEYEKNNSFEFANRNKKIFTLRFEYDFTDKENYAEFCYGIPFTYTELCKQIDKWRASPFVFINKLGESLSGVTIPLITVCETDKESESDEKFDKFVVAISGRLHPSETHGSHIINGFINELLKNSQEAAELRKRVIFKIVPMMNPDGVILGNTRTSLAGKDLNRVYSDFTDLVFPEVINHQQLLIKLSEKYKDNFLFAIDVHGHSTRKNSFFYGPEYSIHHEKYLKCRLLPKLFSNLTEIFRYYSCKFRIESSKKQSCRGYFNSKGVVSTYTFETSMHGYFDFKNRKDKVFDLEELENLGKSMMLSIYEYVRMEPKKLMTLEMQKELLLLEPANKNEGSSDEDISEKADSESSSEDFNSQEMFDFYHKINENTKKFNKEIFPGVELKNLQRNSQKKIENSELKTFRKKSETHEKPKTENLKSHTKSKSEWIDKFSHLNIQEKHEKRRKSVILCKTIETKKNTQNTTFEQEAIVPIEESKRTLAFEEVEKERTFASSRSIAKREEAHRFLAKKEEIRTINVSELTQFSRRANVKKEVKETIQITSKLFDSSSLEKLMMHSRPQYILYQTESKKSLEKIREIPKIAKETISVKILSRKKSIKNIQEYDKVCEAKMKLKGESVPTKLPFIDKYLPRW